jgi:hypothetical protein
MTRSLHFPLMRRFAGAPFNPRVRRMRVDRCLFVPIHLHGFSFNAFEFLDDPIGPRDDLAGTTTISGEQNSVSASIFRI